MPDASEKLRVLAVAPYLNRDGTGEVYSIFKWVEALSERCEVTVMAVTDGNDLSQQLSNARVIESRSPRPIRWLGPINHSLKPWLPVFFRQVRRWIKRERAAGINWDIAHQMLPQGMRYASPLRGMGLPYVVGPLGGSLPTPPGLLVEAPEHGLKARARRLDHVRLRTDVSLRQGYEGAQLILGVAPYVYDTLKNTNISVRRFEPVLERAHEGAFPEVTRTSGVGEAHLLHVGRGVRTKGLRDTIRALAQLDDLPGVRLTAVGEGAETTFCQEEAERLGVANRVVFTGKIPRQEVDQHYADADVFCFPSFREPMGGVVFEAMEWRLPIIAAACGGPDFILDDASAIKVAVDTPDQFVDDIAAAIRTLAMDPDQRRRMGDAAADRLRNFGGWSEKAERLETLYREVLAADQ